VKTIPNVAKTAVQMLLSIVHRMLIVSTVTKATRFITNLRVVQRALRNTAPAKTAAVISVITWIPSLIVV